MSTITKRGLVNPALENAGFITLTNSETSNEFNRALNILERLMIAIAGNEGAKVGYIKSSNREYVEPDEESGVADHLEMYVIDYLTYKVLGAYQMPITTEQREAYLRAQTYILPELEPPIVRIAPIPLGTGNRTRQEDLIYKPIYDDDIELTKATDLNFDD